MRDNNDDFNDFSLRLHIELRISQFFNSLTYASCKCLYNLRELHEYLRFVYKEITVPWIYMMRNIVAAPYVNLR